MKLLPDLWIAHPEADSEPVSFKRWLWWKLSEILYAVAGRLDSAAGRAEHRALYPGAPYDDITF